MKRDVEILVNAGKSQGRLDNYWRYIGFDECNFAYTPEGLELLRKFGKLEQEAYYIRSHFMFNTDNCHGVPKYGSTGEWARQGKPWYPDEKQYEKIKSRDSLECLAKKLINVKDGVLVHDFEMPAHSISFLVFEKAGGEK